MSPVTSSLCLNLSPEPLKIKFERARLYIYEAIYLARIYFCKTAPSSNLFIYFFVFFLALFFFIENTASKTSTLLFHRENSMSGDLIIIVRAVGTYLHSCQQTTYSATSKVSHATFIISSKSTYLKTICTSAVVCWLF